jgi:hypothetical protein
MRSIVREEVDVVADDEQSSRSVVRAPWSPAQIVALVIGLVFTVMGGVTLARTGIDFSDVAATHTEVAGLHHTVLLGVIELFLGLLMLGAGAVPGAGRGSMSFLGILLLGFGLIVAIQPSTFHASLGMHASNGVFYLITGVVMLVAAMVAPVFFDDTRVSTRRRVVA